MRLRLEAYKVEAILDYVARPSQKQLYSENNNNNNNNQKIKLHKEKRNYLPFTVSLDSWDGPPKVLCGNV